LAKHHFAAAAATMAGRMKHVESGDNVNPENAISFDEELKKHLANLEVYADLLAAFNAKARLTGPPDSDTIMGDHIHDCVQSLRFAPDIGRVVDVGSGGGLPGIVWAICRPHLNVVLMESIARKCAALSEMAAMLGLENVSVECQRSETFAAEHREMFSIAVCRAVGHAGVIAEYMAPLVAPQGCLLAFKGPRVFGEIEEIEDRWNELGLKAPELFPYSTGGKNLYLVRWKKHGACPARYPRRPGQAQKKHWWR